MQTIQTIAELIETLALWRRENSGRVLALVPTMGYLHPGHLSLLAAARHRADAVLVSLFVNPRQFNDPEDYRRYPIDLEQDTRLCRDAGVDFLFVPESQEMYPQDAPELQIDIPELTNRLEGLYRPGHMQGVLLICARLFALIRPDLAFFGKKDYQQLVLIQHLVSLLNFPLQIVGCETIRSERGLALSSRNVRLSEKALEHALLIRRSLLILEKEIHEGEKNAATLKEIGKDIMESGSLNRVEYISVASRDRLDELVNLTAGESILVSTAVFTDGVRLIDNIEVTVP
ncbi:MAG: pantoate--beta-alanine ligase [Spirochaetales bacterium]|nr:pantoate--beta-alanine ligase [Spirochaetales bacterium]